MTATAMKPSGFAMKLESLMREVRFQRATREEEHDALARLRYLGNLREGTIEANETERLRDSFDELESCYNMGMFIDERLVGTLRVLEVSPASPRSVLAAAYPDFIGPLLENGATIADTSRLAIDFQASREYPCLPYVAMRLVFMAADHMGADHIMAGVRREHIPFYKREFCATALTEPRFYPSVIKPMVLFDVPWSERRPQVVGHRSFYDSTEAERVAAFGPAVARG